MSFNAENAKIAESSPMNGLFHHLPLTLRLNFRSRQPIIYGYLVPILFLIAFASVFRTTQPPLAHPGRDKLPKFATLPGGRPGTYNSGSHSPGI